MPVPTRKAISRSRETDSRSSPRHARHAPRSRDRPHRRDPARRVSGADSRARRRTRTKDRSGATAQAPDLLAFLRFRRRHDTGVIHNLPEDLPQLPCRRASRYFRTHSRSLAASTGPASVAAQAYAALVRGHRPCSRAGRPGHGRACAVPIPIRCTIQRCKDNSCEAASNRGPADFAAIALIELANLSRGGVPVGIPASSHSSWQFQCFPPNPGWGPSWTPLHTPAHRLGARRRRRKASRTGTRTSALEGSGTSVGVLDAGAGADGMSGIGACAPTTPNVTSGGLAMELRASGGVRSGQVSGAAAPAGVLPAGTWVSAW